MLELLSCDWRISFASIPYSYSWSFVTQLKFGPGDIERLEVLPGSKVERTSERTLRIPDKGQAAFVALAGTWVGVSDQVEQRLPDGTVLPPVTMVIIKEPGSESDPQRIRVTSGESMAIPLGRLPVVVSNFRRKHKRQR